MCRWPKVLLVLSLNISPSCDQPLQRLQLCSDLASVSISAHLCSFRFILPMHFCQICVTILEISAKHVAQYGEAPWQVVYVHEFTHQQTTSTLVLSAQSGCYFCKQFWDSLTEQHHKMLSSPEFGECTIALFWDEQAAKHMKLQFFLGPEFDTCDDSKVTDTFELLGMREGIIYAPPLEAKTANLGRRCN
jgi:hypothetical protein